MRVLLKNEKGLYCTTLSGGGITWTDKRESANVYEDKDKAFVDRFLKAQPTWTTEPLEKPIQKEPVPPATAATPTPANQPQKDYDFKPRHRRANRKPTVPGVQTEVGTGE